MILPLAEEAEASHNHTIFNLFLRGPEFFDRSQRLVQPFAGRARRRLDNGDDIALVFGGQEAAGKPKEKQSGQSGKQEENCEATHRSVQDPLVGLPVAIGHLAEPAVEATKEAPRRTAGFLYHPAPAIGYRLVGLTFGGRLVAVALNIFLAKESRTQRRRQR